ncbi:Crp/Fnr family transcriptional regulator [Pelistega europaea]|uniref:Crp/Fnr family transcriptional regulator n=1 Tax=Pelistega europaea TaxID=106147 RepID=A0A7Y4L813_9BURK|nr:Crp/Fnr family transcriptional regulator [Pelistega europaea]NOL48700.1 Crp/Fnr family transcriptional regulator [Pelistega europaea]
MSIFTNYHAQWFDLLAPEHQQRVCQDMHIIQAPAGTMIAKKGEKAQHWIGVLEGLIKVSVGNSEGRITSLTGIPAGGWLGEGSLLKKETRRYDIFALRDSKIAKLPLATFEWLLDNSIPFNRFLLELLNERVSQFIGRTENDRLLDADGRVTTCLAELFNQKLYPNTDLRLAITQEEIGYLARVSRQRANKALRKLGELGVIRVEYGAIQVLDLNRLKSMYRDE